MKKAIIIICSILGTLLAGGLISFFVIKKKCENLLTGELFEEDFELLE